MGLADDAYNTKPLVKLAVQIMCGVIFVWSGTYIDIFHVYYVDAALTILWVIIIMNSLNMLDNMDGITGTTVLFILLACLFGGWLVFDFNANIWTLTLVAVIGAIIGFLRYNIHPSKLFMGDAGSQFIGLFVAFFGVKYLWNVSSSTETNAWASVIVTLVAFTPAAADTLTVVINRLKRGQSPMVGGKDHTTHHLVYAGFKDIQVWYVFVLIGLVSFILSMLMIYLIQLNIILPIIFFFFISFWFSFICIETPSNFRRRINNSLSFSLLSLAIKFQMKVFLILLPIIGLLGCQAKKKHEELAKEIQEVKLHTVPDLPKEMTFVVKQLIWKMKIFASA